MKKAKCNVGQGWMLGTVEGPDTSMTTLRHGDDHSQTCLDLFSILQFTVCCPYVVLFNPQTTLYGRHFVPICRCERPRLSNCFAQGYRTCVWGAPLGPGFLAVPISQLACPGSRCFILVIFSLYALIGSV